MYNYYERTYYTLDDIRKAAEINPTLKGPYSLYDTSFNTFMKTIFQSVGYIYRSGTIDTNESQVCFRDYIWPRFYQEAIIYTDLDESESFLEKFCSTKAGQIMSWWTASSEKYKLLIQNLNANKSKLLDDVKSSSIARFNDTPQNSGDFADDNHTSNITKTESSSNVGTMMQRLNEIEDKIKQLYLDWSDEFRKFIIWSVN